MTAEPTRAARHPHSPGNDLDPAAADAPLLALIPELSGRGDPYTTYLDRLASKTSQQTMRGCLDAIARLVLEEEHGGPLPEGEVVTGACRSWWRLRYKHTARIRSLLVSSGRSYSTVNKHLVALRQVLRECHRLELMSADDYTRAVDIAGVKGSRRPAGRNVHEDELAAMLRHCRQHTGPKWVRNAALVALLWSTGLRRAEAAAANIDDYDPGTRALRITGKGNRERIVYVIPSAVPYLDAWLRLVGGRAGRLFRRVRGKRISQHGMSPKAIGAIVNEVREGAGLPPLTTHDMRRTFVGELLDAGVDLPTAQKLAGHASPVTTARYDRRPEHRLQAANDRLRLPDPDG